MKSIFFLYKSSRYYVTLNEQKDNTTERKD